jgi:hypothetical protein
VRSLRRLVLPALALATTLSWAADSLAEPPDSRFGVLPLIGAGGAALTAPSPLPGFIGYTTLGGEIFAQLRTWGLFIRFDTLSSGPISTSMPTHSLSAESGWNAYGIDLGVSYRLFGDSHTLSLFGRAGLAYEHWIALVNSPCAVVPFIPSACNTLGSSSAGYEGDAIGATIGVRLEFPIRSFYVAVGANFLPLVTFNTSSDSADTLVTALQPGDVFQLRFDVAVGLRDAREHHAARHDIVEHGTSY